MKCCGRRPIKHEISHNSSSIKVTQRRKSRFISISSRTFLDKTVRKYTNGTQRESHGRQNSNNYSIGNHFFKVLVQIHYSLSKFIIFQHLQLKFQQPALGQNRTWTATVQNIQEQQHLFHVQIICFWLFIQSFHFKKLHNPELQFIFNLV